MASPLAGALVVGGVLAVSIGARGGFFAAGQLAFVALAGGALAAAALRDPDGAAAALRSRPVLTLAALGTALAVSATWTVAAPAEALRAGVVSLGAAGLAAASAVLCPGRAGALRLGAGVAVVAAIAAAAGLVGAVDRSEPWAERIGGTWRPGGPFEYAPALALLQVAALPAMLVALTAPGRGPRVAGAAGAALAGAVVGLSHSRLHVALGLLVLLAAVVWAPSVLGVRGGPVAAIAAALVVVAVGAEASVGGYAAPGVVRGAGERALSLTLVVTGGAVAVVLAGTAAARRRRGDERRADPAERAGSGAHALAPVVSAGLGVAAVLAASMVVVSAPVPGPGAFDHGRVELWVDAARAGADRPLLGFGGASFVAATESLQGGAPVRFAHSLPMELWVELGIVGLGLAIALVVAAGRAVLRVADPVRTWLLAPAVGAVLVAALVDWPFHFAGLTALFAACLGPLAWPSPGNRCNGVRWRAGSRDPCCDRVLGG